MNQQNSMQYIDDSTRPKVKLQSSISTRVPCDQMEVSLSFESRGQSLNALNKEVIQAINDAMALAKSYPTVKAKNDDIETSRPWHEDKDDDPGYVVTGTIILRSTDKEAVAALAGILALSMKLNRVRHSLSEARRKIESNKLMQALGDEFRQRASDIARSFGYSRFVICSLDFGNSSSQYMIDSPALYIDGSSMLSARMPDDKTPSLTTEGGEASVDLSVSGTIELL